MSTFHGWAFDTCHTPPVATMRPWVRSDYRAVGVYYAGRGRALQAPGPPEPRLDARGAGDGLAGAAVVRGVAVALRHREEQAGGTHRTARLAQGTGEGRDAVSRAKALGIAAGQPALPGHGGVRLPEEKCARTTLAFVRAWDREVRRQGYVPGFYSSADSGVRHMETARRAGMRDLPAVMWFARWHTQPQPLP